MGVAVEHQGRLVDAVDDAISGDLVGGIAQAGEGREKIGYVNHVADDGIGFDHARPANVSVNTHATFQGGALAAAEDHRGITGLRGILGEVAIVTHDNDNRVISDPQFIHLIHQFADPLVHQLHLLDIDAAVRCGVFVGGRTRAG